METIQVKEVQKLKLNVTNINSFLKKSSKDYTKVKKDNKRLVSDQVKRKKTKEKEKTIEKKGLSGSSPLSNVKQVAESSAGIFDKILSFGGILLSGILLNALPSIKKKVDKFAKDNKEIIGNVTKSLIVVKDFTANLFDAFTGPYSQENSLDWLGKFNDSGKLESGVLKKVEQAFDGVGIMINAIDKALGGEGKVGNFVITGERILAKQGGKTGEYNITTKEFTPRAFTEEENRRYQSGDFRPEGSTDPSTGERDSAHGSGGGGRQSGAVFDAGKGGTGKRIFLHWSAGAHSTPYSAYHSIALGDGTLIRNTPYSQDKSAHTAGANSNSVGLAIAAMGGEGVSENNFGPYPPTEKQLNVMIGEAAKLALEWGWSEGTVDSNVRTHGEWERYATRTGKLPGKPQRWDVDKLRQSDPNIDTSKVLSHGGNELRNRIKQKLRELKNQGSKMSRALNPSNNKPDLFTLLNTNIGEKGSTTIIHARQPILT